MKLADKSGAKRAVIVILITVLIVGAFVGGFFAGRSGQRVEEKPIWSYSEVVYAEIISVDNGYFHVDGLDVNDINGRGEFTFSADEHTRLIWRGTPLSLSDFEAGDRIAFSYVGEVLETYPAQVQSVVEVKLLDDEV